LSGEDHAALAVQLLRGFGCVGADSVHHLLGGDFHRAVGVAGGDFGGP